MRLEGKYLPCIGDILGKEKGLKRKRTEWNAGVHLSARCRRERENDFRVIWYTDAT